MDHSVASIKQENSRRLAADFAARRDVFAALPEVISLHTTDRCNLRCVMCPRSERVGRSSLARDALRRVCDALFPAARKAIVTGNQGEPMVADFDVVVDAAQRHEVPLDLVTNGTLLTGERYAAIEAALRHLNVSIDSHLPEVYERIRVGGRFDLLRRNLEEIAQRRRASIRPPLWTFSAVVMRSNLDHLAGLVEFAADLGADAVILQPLRQFVRRIEHEDVIGDGGSEYRSGRGSGCPDPFRGRQEMRQRLDARFDEARRAARARRINLYFSDFQFPAVESRPLRREEEDLADSRKMCWYLLRGMSIYDNGAVYPCNHPTDYCRGDVHREDVRELWNGAKMRSLRRAHFSLQGTLFCSGCLHAAYLPAPTPSKLRDAAKSARLAVGHARNLWARWRHPSRAGP